MKSSKTGRVDLWGRESSLSPSSPPLREGGQRVGKWGGELLPEYKRRSMVGRHSCFDHLSRETE